MNEDQPPPVIFTQEQREAYKEHQNFTDEDGLILWGKLKGVPLDEARDTDYLHRVVVRCIANAILIQDRISGADPDRLRRLIAANPQYEAKYRRYFASEYGVTIPPILVEAEES